MHFKGFFYINPLALRKANLAFLSAVGLKKTHLSFKGHNDHSFCNIFYFIFLTVKSRYMHSVKKN